MSFDSAGLSSVAAGAVGTIGTVAIATTAIKAVGKATGNMNKSGSHRKPSGRKGKKSKSYSVWG